MENDRAQVAVPPPLFYLVFFAAGVVLHLLWRPIYIFPIWWLGHVVGWSLFLVAFAIFLWALLTMRRAGENIRVERPTNTIVSVGPYARSRNPMYVSLTITYIGIALVVNSAWPLILLPVTVLTVHFAVIRQEEKYLEGKFGDEYRQYKARVRRWV